MFKTKVFKEQAKSFPATAEQIANANYVKQGLDVKVVSGAGSGKSSSLRYIAEQVPDKNILVLCFNKANADESAMHSERPENIYYATINSIAYGKVVDATYRKKLSFLSYKDLERYTIAESLGLSYEDSIVATKSIINAITAYCRSDIAGVTEGVSDYLHYWHSSESKNPDKTKDFTPSQIDMLTQIADSYWDRVTNRLDNCAMSHDVYLKMYQLAGCMIDEYYCKQSKRYVKVDILALDECLTGKHTVKTDKGLMRIKRLYTMWKNGETLPLILSYNIDKGNYEYKPMLSALESKDRETLLIKTEGLNKLECTPNHKVLTQRGYVPAGELIIGQDYLLLDNPENQKAKYVLNKDQYQVVLGSFLGDGSLEKRSEFNTYRLKFTQGVKQKQYLEDKAAIFNISNIGNIESGYTGEKSIYTAQSNTFVLEKPIWRCLKDLDVLGLAIWYMDDGSLSDRNIVTIHSNAFNEVECITLKNLLWNNFNLICDVRNYNRFYQLNFSVTESTKLLKLIAEYMHEDLKYKNPYIRNPTFDFDCEFLPYGANYVSSIESIGKKTVYDIEVADNHNFITTRTIDNSSGGSGIIVHNCQDTNPVSEAIFRRQKHLQRVIVGDPMQQLYAWRGAKDIMSMEYYDSFTTGFLSESFRFNQAIADKANFVLRKAGSKLSLRGSGTKDIITSRAILCRTNATVVEELLSLMVTKPQAKLYTSIDLKDTFSKLYHMEAAWFDSVPRYPCKELSHIVDKASLLQAIEMSDDIARLHKLRQSLVGTSTITKVKKELEERLVGNMEEADIVVSTIHKFKGLQQPYVEISDDLVGYSDKDTVEEIRERLWESKVLTMLLYVAITRAEVEVQVPWYLEGVLGDSEQLYYDDEAQGIGDL